MSSERREILELLGELSSFYPEMRLGQLLSWFAGVARGQTPESVYDVEDSELAAVMRDHLAKCQVERATHST